MKRPATVLATKDLVVPSLSLRWWIVGTDNDRLQRAIMYGVAKSWTTKVNRLLDRNKQLGLRPRTQEEFADLIGMDKTNVFIRGAHAAPLGRFLLMAHHLNVSMQQLLPDEIDIIASATSILVQEDTNCSATDELYQSAVVYSTFQVCRNWNCRDPFDPSSLANVIQSLDDTYCDRTEDSKRSWNCAAIRDIVLDVASKLSTVQQYISSKKCWSHGDD